jgi:hypothetical protein
MRTEHSHVFLCSLLGRETRGFYSLHLSIRFFHVLVLCVALYGTMKILHSRFVAVIHDLLEIRQGLGVMISGIMKFGAHKISSTSSSLIHFLLLHLYFLFGGTLVRPVG